MMKRTLISIMLFLSLMVNGGMVYAENEPINNNDGQIVNALKFLSVPSNKHKMLIKCIKVAALTTGFDTELIIALMKTESDFNPKARSPKNYKGLMQTPKATFRYPEVDTLYGAKILEEKMTESNGNLLEALALYKGGNNPVARRYARQTYRLYKKLKENNKIIDTQSQEIVRQETIRGIQQISIKLNHTTLISKGEVIIDRKRDIE